MIQRIQSIYLSVMGLLNGLALSIFFMDWKDGQLILISLTFVILVLGIWAILSYKNRAVQIKINRVNLIISLALFSISIYYLLTLPGGFSPEKGIEFMASGFTALVAFLLLIFANKAILKDIELVKSVDRIR